MECKKKKSVRRLHAQLKVDQEKWEPCVLEQQHFMFSLLHSNYSLRGPGSVVQRLWFSVSGPGSVVQGSVSVVQGQWSRVSGPGSVVQHP